MTGQDLALAAEALVGAPFRLHGRDPASGLDCLGVLAVSLAGIGRQARLPSGYALRTRKLPELSGFVSGCGLGAASGQVQPGDVLLVQVGPGQVHLLIAARAQRFVHAHAGLRKVVLGDLPAHWALLEHWRLRAAD